MLFYPASRWIQKKYLARRYFVPLTHILLIPYCAWFWKKRIRCSSLITDHRVHMSSSRFPLCSKARCPQSSSMRSHIHLYVGEKAALKYFRFSPMLTTPADRCSKRQLPGLVSSLYSRQLTHPHYITIRLPLKVILPEHNHTQSKAQTSYIKETVNSLRVHSMLP